MHGRDHNNRASASGWRGGGVKGGTIVGATDECGYKAVENPKSAYELHATILHLGLNHEKLPYRFDGRDMQLPDVHGKVIGGYLPSLKAAKNLAPEPSYVERSLCDALQSVCSRENASSASDTKRAHSASAVLMLNS